MWRLLLHSLLAVCAHGASADVETRPIFSNDAWTVELSYDATDRAFWCSATTANRSDQRFSITISHTDHTTLTLTDKTLDGRERPVRYLVDLDYNRRMMDGSEALGAVTLVFTGVEETLAFLQDMKSAKALAIRDQDGLRLGAFRLAGAEQAVDNLVKCWGTFSRSGAARSLSERS